MNSCLIPRWGGTLDHRAERDALWAKFFTAAPARQRRSVARLRGRAIHIWVHVGRKCSSSSLTKSRREHTVAASAGLRTESMSKTATAILAPALVLAASWVQ